ncbi:MAG TPA: hypothetical protein VFF53_01840 [Geobacteraceae bacterium]|nr:hypothetical protein [Geobacteraceae bacterium]
MKDVHHLLASLIPLILLIACLTPGIAVAAPRYAVAIEATPVLNSPDLRTALTRRDTCGQVRAVEFIALPGTVFTITGEQKSDGLTVYRVTSIDYPYPSATGYFVDSRGVRLEREKPAERGRSLPGRAAIIAAMKRRVGTGYVWGGNVAEGIRDGWGEGNINLLAGLDCSGLLYEATGGYTPRNTGSLVNYGSAVPISGKTAETIAAGLRPLDLIAWPGHVLIVIDDGNVIESRLVCGKTGEGVRIRPVRTALADIMRSRRPVDAIRDKAREFVVRRWYRAAE